MYYLSRSPCPTPTSPEDRSPRSRPTESGSARASFRLRSARLPSGTWLRSGGFPITPIFGTAERQGKGRTRNKVGRLASSRPLTGSYLTGQTPEILISVIFLCRSVHSSRFGRLLAQLGKVK